MLKDPSSLLIVFCLFLAIILAVIALIKYKNGNGDATLVSLVSWSLSSLCAALIFALLLIPHEEVTFYSPAEYDVVSMAKTYKAADYIVRDEDVDCFNMGLRHTETYFKFCCWETKHIHKWDYFRTLTKEEKRKLNSSDKYGGNFVLD